MSQVSCKKQAEYNETACDEKSETDGLKRVARVLNTFIQLLRKT